jgi:hypothetical protein
VLVEREDRGAALIGAARQGGLGAC